MVRHRIVLSIALVVGTAAFATAAVTRANHNSSPASAESKLTNRDVVGMVKAGLPADVIDAKIESSRCSFDTSPSALEGLKAAGVPNSVILRMVDASDKAAARPRAGDIPGSPRKSAHIVASGTSRGQTPPGAPIGSGNSLWIARFTGQPKATAAIAAVQQGDVAALRQSALFKTVTSFIAAPQQPLGTWSLSAKELSYSRGSAAKRVMIGLGTGRAHIVMEYALRDPNGRVKWKKKIKTEPSFWSAGGIQNQSVTTKKQAQKLIDGLSTFLTAQD